MRWHIQYHTTSSRTVHHLLLGIAVLLLAGGCVPKIEPVRYISLQGYPDAHVTERTQGTPEQPHLFVGEIPTRYQIDRQGYTLALTILPGHLSPKITIRIHSDPGHQLGLHPLAEKSSASCVKWVQKRDKPDQLFFRSWCSQDHHSRTVDMHLRFEVIDQHGIAVANEVIPYTVEQNGYYGYIDAV